MSHHVLHIRTHGAVLSVTRGRIHCKSPDGNDRHLATEDLLAVILAARGVTLTSSFMTALLSSDAVLLHCDESYRPLGLTAGLARCADPQVTLRQAALSQAARERLWRVLLTAKVANQAAVLAELGRPSPLAPPPRRQRPLNEAAAARRYWKGYFTVLGATGARRRTTEDTPINHQLNYGYAVLASLVHRAAIIHGLNPLIGLHHAVKFKAHPLVYDLMEPLRPFVDLPLARWRQQHPGAEMAEWCKVVANGLAETRLQTPTGKLQLLYAIDSFVASVAQAIRRGDPKALWLPSLSHLALG